MLFLEGLVVRREYQRKNHLQKRRLRGKILIHTLVDWEQTYGEDMLVVGAGVLDEKMDLFGTVESVETALAWKKGL